MTATTGGAAITSGGRLTPTFKLKPAMLVPEKANKTKSIANVRMSFVFIFSPPFLFG